jgi:hypothetical protein
MSDGDLAERVAQLETLVADLLRRVDRRDRWSGRRTSQTSSRRPSPNPTEIRTVSAPIW